MRKILIGILSLLLITCCCIAFVGCDNSGEQKYDYLVTYNYNVGNIQDKCPEQYLGVMDGSLTVEPGSEALDKFKLETIQGYVIDGWYLPAELDGDKQPVKDENGFVVLGKKWDFSTDRVTQDTVLYANLTKYVTLTVMVEKGDESTGTPDQTIVFSGKPGSTKTKPTRSTQIPKKEGYTFYDYYVDEAFTTRFEWPYEFKDGVNTVIYARFIKGENLVFVSTVEKLKEELISNTKNIYIDRELMAEEGRDAIFDFSEIGWLNSIEKSGRTFSHQLWGNGCIIKGITLSYEGTRSDRDGFALFNELKEGAKISDVTFENVTINFKTTQSTINMKVAMFASHLNKGATVSNVTISGTLSLTLPQTNTINYENPFIADVVEGATIENCNYNGIKVVVKTV